MRELKAQALNITGLRTKKHRMSILLFTSLAALGASLGVVIAYLVANRNWQIALGLLAVLPTFVLLHRYPLSGLFIWLLFAPFLVATGGGLVRKMYWLIHRALPPATLGIMVLSSFVQIRRYKLPKLGWAELSMAGYIIVSLVSIINFSAETMATIYLLYDRVLIPMCLYLIIRLAPPNEKDLQRLIPVLIFVLLSQSIIGLLSWSVPQVLPSAWLNRAGLRTTGSLRSYSVFTSTLVFCGLLLLHRALNYTRVTKIRKYYLLLFFLALFMIFLAYSRGSWLAGLVVILGLFATYPRFMFRLGVSIVASVIILLSSGLLNNQISWARQRLYSENSAEAALSRLPVYYASIRMFEAKPFIGWGYGNFDRFDRQFQERVGDLISPTKDHASHNLYLTLIAEQGIIGLSLYLAPLLWWSILTLKARQRIPSQGFWSRKLVSLLWLVIVFHIIINNFSNMRVVFGLGMWWITLGLIASIIYPYLSSGADFTKAEEAVAGERSRTLVNPVRLTSLEISSTEGLQ